MQPASGRGRDVDPAGDTVDLHATGGLSDDDEVDLDYNDASEGENNHDDDERSSRADEPSVSERSVGKRRRSGSPKAREAERTTRARADEPPSTSEPIASVVLPKAAPPPPPPPIDREKVRQQSKDTPPFSQACGYMRVVNKDGQRIHMHWPSLFSLFLGLLMFHLSCVRGPSVCSGAHFF